MTNKYFISDDSGFVLVVSLMILLILLLLGMAAVNTTTVELYIAGNERADKKNFFVAESGWIRGLHWIELNASPPDRQNTSITDPNDKDYAVVRNYGNGSDGYINDTFPDGTEDNSDESTASILRNNNVDYIPCWYRIEEIDNRKVPGSGSKYRDFNYKIISNANREREIQVTAHKVFKVGY